MKLFFIISLVVLIPLGNLFCQDKVYLDTTGKEISFTEFQVKWRDRDTLRTRWDYIGKDGKRYCQLKKTFMLLEKFKLMK
ncbi:hypothetical protein CLV33_101112 [Jejuia pallidilutea]|uniref:Uncharacterized protein n=1 Tax=Jejuia pallidilutea TaxID=504487 RepID=A0A362XAF9_9FLAO|nr:hypothetical protein CLV33_101112 [Jejuia pallidilutea]